MVTELVSNNFNEFVKENTLAIIDCWAPWCGPCRRMTPIMEELAEDMKGKAGVAKLNVDDSPDISAKYGINAIPTILIFKNGELIETMVGLRTKDEIVSRVNEL